MKKTGSIKLFLILQIIIAALETVGLIIAISRHGLAIMGFYTQESNLVMLIAAVIYVVYALTHKEQEVPKWIMVLQYVATCMVTVTFVTVILVLIPMVGFEWAGYFLFEGSNLYHHLLGPIFAALAFLVFEREFCPTFVQALIAAAPTLFYAIVTTFLNVAKVIRGPYPFLYVYEQPWWMSVMWFIVIPTGAFLFALLFGFIKRKIMGKSEI